MAKIVVRVIEIIDLSREIHVVGVVVIRLECCGC